MIIRSPHISTTDGNLNLTDLIHDMSSAVSVKRIKKMRPTKRKKEMINIQLWLLNVLYRPATFLLDILAFFFSFLSRRCRKFVQDIVCCLEFRVFILMRFPL